MSCEASPFSPWIGMAAVVGGARLCLAATCWHRERFRTTPELSRKLLHVALGTGFMAFPWLFREAWPVVTVCGAFVALLAIRRAVPRWQREVGGVMHAVGRRSHGEYWFPVAAATLFVLAGRNPLLYCGPLALLTYADAAAAIVGTRYGAHPFRIAGATKSVEGATACFATSLVCITLALTKWSPLTPGNTAPLACVFAALTTLLELIAPKGLDNLAIPLTAWVMLRAVS